MKRINLPGMNRAQVKSWISLLVLLPLMTITPHLLGQTFCERPIETTFQAGDQDNFEPPFEPASPSSGLAEITQTLVGTPPLAFDELIRDRPFIHSFRNLPMKIVSAQLTIGLRATSSGATTNDGILLEPINATNQFSWNANFASLLGSWGPNDQAVLTIDLGNLMPSANGNGRTSVLDTMEDGVLDILIEDDTGVDFMTLTIEHCPCNSCSEPTTQIFQTGDEDGFEGPVSPATQSEELASLNFSRGFDDPGSNRIFGHTISGLPKGITEASLEIHVRAQSGGSSNDTINLEFLGSSPGNSSVAWIGSLAQLTGLPWNNGDEATITLDLVNLPAPSQGLNISNILDFLRDGDLDVMVQDDTMVDYLILTVTFCEELQDDTRLVYSWVSNREGQFESIVVADNYGDDPVNLTLTARRPDCTSETVGRSIPPRGFLKESAASLFPGLGSGDGYTIRLDASQDHVRGRWVTNNLVSESGASPSQGVAVKVPCDNIEVNERVGQHVLYGYLPITGNNISAPVIVNISNAPLNVTLWFFTEQGLLVGTHTLSGLEPYCPEAILTNALVPSGTGDVYMVASADRDLLTGVAFVFDQVFNEPAIGNVTGIPFTPPDP